MPVTVPPFIQSVPAQGLGSCDVANTWGWAEQRLRWSFVLATKASAP